MRKGYRITLGVLTIMILLTLTIGTSYSYYSVGGVQDKDNVLATRCFEITYEDGNGTSAITLNNSYPMSDDKGMSKSPYNFTITNTCKAENESVNYKLVLARVGASSGTDLDPLMTNLNYALKISNTDSTTGKTQLTAHKYSDIDSRGSFDFLSQDNDNVLGAGDDRIDVNNSFILSFPGATDFSGVLSPGESKSYSLNLWIDENACSNNESCEKIMNTGFKGRLLVYAYV
ncbi:MAG: hypothetical protein NC483_00210 [Ruminococcus sp.]|nr:hypothetical protein [Ruminococcus sp.]